MHSKIVAIAAVAALAEQASAYNHNRHSHNIAKRAIETAWETVWETVYVTEGQEPVPTEPAVDPTLPIITSTSVVVIPTTTQAPPPPTTEAPPPAPPAPTTTLVTSIAPVVEEPQQPEQPEQPVEQPEQPVEQPEQPVEQPEQPVEQPEQPVEQPEQPVEQPEQPVEQPEQPVEQPEQPVEQPEQPPVVENPTTEEPAPSPPASGVPSKRGMAYNSAALANSFNAACESCSWAYNWASSAGDLDSSVSFVPMCWGEKSFGHWHQEAEAAIAGGAKAILGFNEPDHADQANMAPAQAAAFHKQHMNQYSGKVLVGSPAVTNGGGEMGLTWLKNFFAACDAQEGGCAVDFCAVHWYSEAQYADTLLTHIEQAHEICGGRPIWLTEFAPLGDANQISEFMTNMIPKLDAIDYLHAYSYFWVDTSSLMSSESSLSSFGQIYASI